MNIFYEMNQTEILFISLFCIVVAMLALIFLLFYIWPDAMPKIVGYAMGAAFLYWFFTPIGEISAFLFAYLILREMTDSKKIA